MYTPSVAGATVGTGAVGALAFTGAYTLMLIAIGVFLIGGGVMLAAASRRGRRRGRVAGNRTGRVAASSSTPT